MLSLLNLRSCSHILQWFTIIVCFSYIYSPFTFKTKTMDSLLFLIKKHNNKTAGYNDMLYGAGCIVERSGTDISYTFIFQT